MKIRTVTAGFLQENCYIYIKDNECIVIDPGNDYPKIKEAIGSLKVLCVLVTHSHYDHMGAMFDLLEDFDVKVYRYENLEEKNYKINNFEFEAIFTPGHTMDCYTYYFKDDNIMFTGDFIFKDSIGRTDLPTGDDNDMNKSIKKISKYDKSIIVYPGHQEITTLGYIIDNNKYFIERNN